MFVLIAFVAVMVLLGVLVGAGYPQTWASRWGISGR